MGRGKRRGKARGRDFTEKNTDVHWVLAIWVLNQLILSGNFQIVFDSVCTQRQRTTSYHSLATENGSSRTCGPRSSHNVTVS